MVREGRSKPLSHLAGVKPSKYIFINVSLLLLSPASGRLNSKRRQKRHQRRAEETKGKRMVAVMERR
jgi:hypothetical protein